MSMVHWWNDNDKENRSTARKTCHNATLYTINLTWTDLGLKAGPRNETPPTDRLNRGTVIFKKTKIT